MKFGELLQLLKDDDLVIITADHGNDPTYTGTDHTREKVPFLAYSPSMQGSGRLETSDTFAAVGATIADNFEVAMPEGDARNVCIGAAEVIFLNADKHSPASSARSTKRRVRGMLMSVGVESSH